MHKPRIYVDTSVFGGYFESEFELWTKILFNHFFEGKYIILFSKLLDDELGHAPKEVRKLALQIPEKFIEFLSISDEASVLSDLYLKENVVGRTSRADCLHIALATLNNADILVSWNFKHIVNINRIRGYNSVNYKQGHKIIEIRTPREIIEYEN